MALTIGGPAPWFAAPTPSSSPFHLSSLGGRYVLLAFLPDPSPEANAAWAHVQAHRKLFDDVNLVAFGVLRHPAAIAAAKDQLPGVRWYLDHDGAISRLYGALDEAGVATPRWVLLDPTLRVLEVTPLDQAPALFVRLAMLGDADRHAGTPMNAPVLIVPRVFEPALCRRLIEEYDKQGGAISGVMREVGGMTVPVVDSFKKRRDAIIDDPELREALRVRIVRRLLPQIELAFQFKATRLERYIVACYDAEEGGYFRPHRDNISKATAHRQFAVSINLNSEEFEGGDLRFPEFGRRTYRPPTGGAVVFSCSLLHEATNVAKGRRYAFLPFLYDDASAKVREANEQYLVTTPAAVDE